MSAVHPMGTMRMGKDPKTSVVASTGEHHHVKGLFVLDGSLFPTSLGGPPQISIYAFAHHLAPHAIERRQRFDRGDRFAGIDVGIGLGQMAANDDTLHEPGSFHTSCRPASALVTITTVLRSSFFVLRGLTFAPARARPGPVPGSS
jgi:hypothetical protein